MSGFVVIVGLLNAAYRRLIVVRLVVIVGLLNTAYRRLIVVRLVVATLIP